MSDGSNPLASSAGWRLSTAGRLLRGEVEEELDAFGLRHRHLAVLLILAASGTSPQGDVARLARMDKSTMVAVVDELEARGLVERRRNPANRRSYELILTGAGAVIVAEARGRVAEVEERFFASLDDRARQQLHEALGRLLTHAGVA